MLSRKSKYLTLFYSVSIYHNFKINPYLKIMIKIHNIMYDKWSTIYNVKEFNDNKIVTEKIFFPWKTKHK